MIKLATDAPVILIIPSFKKLCVNPIFHYKSNIHAFRKNKILSFYCVFSYNYIALGRVNINHIVILHSFDKTVVFFLQTDVSMIFVNKLIKIRRK